MPAGALFKCNVLVLKALQFVPLITCLIFLELKNGAGAFKKCDVLVLYAQQFGPLIMSLPFSEIKNRAVNAMCQCLMHYNLVPDQVPYFFGNEKQSWCHASA